jgi:hypothetical protein
MTKKWTVTVIEDPENPEECILPFPQDLLDQVEWYVGDTLRWELLPGGKARISKVKLVDDSKEFEPHEQ